VKGVSWALALVVAVTLVLMLTVGHENGFGFACFIVFVLALIALAVIGIRALLQHRRAA
jgi:hypothetical protein